MTDLVQAQEELEPVKSLIETALDKDIVTAKDIEEAGYILKQLSDSRHKIEDLRESFTKPLNESLRNINKFFKQFSDPVDGADRILRDKITTFNAQFKKQEEKPRDFSSQSLEVSNRVGGVKMKKVWKFRIKDKAIIPLEFMLVNETALRQAINHGNRNIKGIEIYLEEIPSL